MIRMKIKKFAVNSKSGGSELRTAHVYDTSTIANIPVRIPVTKDAVTMQ